jgi:hypothetical protein
MSYYMKQRIFFTLLIFGVVSVAQAYDVECSGYDSVTGAMVQGECEDGLFTGYDLTGAMSEGNCSAGEMFTAFNPQTGAMIYGNCSSTKNQMSPEKSD